LSRLKKVPLQIYVHTSVFIMLFIIFLYGCSSFNQRTRYSPEIMLHRKFYLRHPTYTICRVMDRRISVTSVCICYDSVIHGRIDFVVYFPYTYFSSWGTHKYISLELFISSNLTEFILFLQ